MTTVSVLRGISNVDVAKIVLARAAHRNVCYRHLGEAGKTLEKVQLREVSDVVLVRL